MNNILKISGRKKQSSGKKVLVARLIIIALLFLPSLVVAQNPGRDRLLFLDFAELSFDLDMAKYVTTFGAVFSDINNDGIDDLIVSNHGYLRPSIYLNQFGQFVDYSYLLPLEREHMDRHGITVIDIDNDGDKDVLITGGGADGIGPGGKNHIYLNLLVETGQFDFRDITDSTNLAQRPMRSRSFTPLASRNGRKVDFYLTALRRQNTTNTYFRNNSSPGHIELVSDSSFNLNGSWDSFGRGLFFDYDRDGDQDYIELKGHKARLFKREQGNYQEVESELDSVRMVTCSALGDFNNDGFLDVVLGRRPKLSYSDYFSFNSQRMHVAFYSMSLKDNQYTSDLDGINISTDAQQVDTDFWTKPGLTSDDTSRIYIGEAKLNPPSLVTTITASQARGKPDIDRDGIYIWHNPQTNTWFLRCKFEQEITRFQGEFMFSQVDDVAPHQLESYEKEFVQDKIFINQEGNGFLELDIEGLKHDQHTRALAVFDFNNDGWQDVIGIRGTERGDYNGDPIILINEYDLTFKKQLVDPFTNPEDDIYQADMLVAGFVNDDGLPDVFMTNGNGLIPGSRGPYKLFINRTPNNHNFVILELEGKDSNRDAIGAQVELFDDEERLIGYRELGAGYNLMQSTHKLHFGLGVYSRKVSARIRWPSGKSVTREVTANSINIIRED